MRSVAMSWNARSSSAWSVERRGDPWALLRRAGDRRLERAVALSRSAAVFGPMPGRAGQAVGRVAAQRDEVRDERRLDPVALLDLAGSICSKPLSPDFRKSTLHPLGGALVHVAVAGDDQSLAAGLRLDGGERSEQVVGLEVASAVSRTPAEAGEELGCLVELPGRAPRAPRVDRRDRPGTARHGSRPPRRRSRRRSRAGGGRRRSAAAAFVAPSSAFTGWPSAPLIESGSAKNERYRTNGASTASSGAGTRRRVDRLARAWSTGRVERTGFG